MKLSILASSLGLALLAIYVTPTLSAPAPAADPEPEPQNCMLESMGVDSEKLGGLLNVILSIVLQLLYNGDDSCKKQELMGDLGDAMGDMKCFMDGMSPETQQTMGGILGPLLEAVDELLESLLGSGGVLGAVGDLLSEVVNLVLCLLNSLGLSLDLDLMLSLGNLLNLDLGALLNLG